MGEYVYRVENDEGKGCYQEGAVALNRLEHHNSYNHVKRHPLPSEDFGIDRYPLKDEKCGFKDMKQLKAWFTPKELKRLARNGFKVVELYVAEVTAYGEQQLLFIE